MRSLFMASWAWPGNIPLDPRLLPLFERMEQLEPDSGLKTIAGLYARRLRSMGLRAALPR